MKILCVLGKHQYGNPVLGIGTEYASFIPAIINLGHEVIHFESQNRHCYKDFADQNRKLLNVVESETPDLMLVVQRDYEIWLETLRIIQRNTDTATACWTTDDNWKYREVSRHIGSSYDLMTTTYPEVVPKYHKDGITNVLLTQWAANSQAIRDPLPARNCQYQVSFVGGAHGDRKKRISELSKYGINVVCFGNGWPNGPVEVNAIPEIMQKSVISLNFTTSKKQGQIKARNFEVPGAGGFLLSEATPGLDQYYSVDKEMAIFLDTSDLVNKIKYYLSNSDERDAIALAGSVRTRKEHTYEIRLKEVLYYAIQAKKKSLTRMNKQSIEFENAVQAHRCGNLLKLLRNLLVMPSIAIWGKERGPRAARRLTFELSWRFLGKRTFSAAGLPGRMFPEQ